MVFSQGLLQTTVFLGQPTKVLTLAGLAGGISALVGHSEVVMCDFAACLLAELERWMLSATPAMIDLNSFADTSDYFTAPSSALEEVSKRLYTDEVSPLNLPLGADLFLGVDLFSFFSLLFLPFFPFCSFLFVRFYLSFLCFHLNLSPLQRHRP